MNSTSKNYVNCQQLLNWRFDNDIKPPSQTNNAKLEFEKSKQIKRPKVFGYVILFLLIVLLCALIFSQ